MSARSDSPRSFPIPPLPAAVVLGCVLLQQCPVVPDAGWRVTLSLLAMCLFALCPIALYGVARCPGARVLATARKARAPVSFVALTLLAFTWAGWQAAQALSERIPPSLEGRDLTLIGYVDELPLESAHGVRFGFRVTACVNPDSDIAALCPIGRRLRLGWSRSFTRNRAGDDDAAPPVRLRPAQTWQLHVRLKQPAAIVNSGLFDAEMRLLEERIAALGYVRKPRGTEPPNQRLDGWHWNLRTVFEAARAAGLNQLATELQGQRDDATGVLLALAFGDQSAIAAADWDVFNRTGVAHLMSISGLHITMLAAIAGALARGALRRRWAARCGLLERIPAVRLQWAVALAVAFAYSGLAGWGIPAQRTCWMLAVTGWALSSGRSRSVFRVLCLAAAVVSVLDPWAPLASGFWLSFAAVAAIVLHASAAHAAPASPATAGRAGHAFLSTIVDAARTQWAATLALLPLGALFFSTLSWISPLANAWAVPLVSVLVTPAVLLLAVLASVLPGVASAVAPLVASPVGWMLDLLRLMADWPGSLFVLAQPDPLSLMLAVLSVAMLLMPRATPCRALWLVGLVPLLLRGPAPVPPDGFRLTALDIGQGMAVLIEADGKRLLYDTGPAWDAGIDAGGRIVVPWLRAQGIGPVDVLVISHADIDHSGGAASVLRLAGSGRVFSSIPSGHRLLVGIAGHQPCRRGDRWQWGKVSFEFLHPGPELPPGAARSPTNALSCVLRIDSPAGSALLAGDIEARQELDLVERLGSRLRSDLLLVPHHGSNTSSTARFIETVAPSLAVVQAGYRNRFRHPTPAVLARYDAAGIRILRTDHQGAIGVNFQLPGRPPELSFARTQRARYWRVRTGPTD